MEDRIITQKQIREFERHLANDEKASATIEKYVRDVRTFFLFSEERSLTKEMVIQYKEFLRCNYAISSVNSMLAALNSFFHVVDWADLCVKPFRVQKQVYCSEEKELSKEEYVRLVCTANRKGKERLALILQTLCSAGLRVSELQFITLESVKRGEIIVQCKGKQRTVFLVSEMRKRLLRYAKKKKINAGAIFVTKSGKPVDRSNVWREMKALCEESDVMPEKVFPHNLRHLFARIFYEIEKDIAKLADVLGHSNINTTRIYTITTGAEHRRHMERMKLVT